MAFLYQISIFLYSVSIRILSFFGHKKARLFVLGRDNQKIKIESFKKDKSRKLYWFHCASLGEFEQGKPLMEVFKEDNVQILLTFFSPSGFEIKKHEPLADFVYYLPLDSTLNAKDFVDVFRPDKAFFIKYEIWPNYFKELNRIHTPIYMVSSTFRENQIYFKSYGKWFFETLKLVSHFFVQDKNSLDLLNNNNFSNTTLSGDTRFDNVLALAKNVEENKRIKDFVSDQPTLILGSSWGEEEEIVTQVFDKISKNFKLIIIPHDVSESHVNQIQKLFVEYKPNLYSDNSEITSKILIVDSIGILRNIYQYASVAFVGGGFKNALHNILEPVVFGLPVIFGNNHSKFHEAKMMIEAKCGFQISNSEKLLELLDTFLEDDNLSQISENAEKFVSLNLGATEKIIEKIKAIELDEKQS